MKKELLYYSVLLLYLETVFHYYMKLDMKYIPVFGGFAIVYGLILCIITFLFSRKVRDGLRGILTLLSSTFFCVELVCRDILQQYFQLFSAMDTAAENRLTDYMSAIILSLKENWLGLALLLVVPGLYWSIMTLRVKSLRWKFKKRCKLFVLLVPVCALLYIAMLGVVYLVPWQGDFTPKMLYQMDTNTDDQVDRKAHV